MITHDRQIERVPSTAHMPAGPAADRFLYPTLRQALYRYFLHSPPARVLLPDYVPEGIHAPLRALGAAVGFYRVPPHLRLDEKEITDTVRALSPDLIVLIHHFGVYVPENVRLLRDVAGPKALVLEDFAHTVHDSRLTLSGDVCVFSHTKMLGVAEGGELLFTNPAARRAPTFSSDTAGDRTLKRLLARQLLLEHLLATRAHGRRSQGMLLRIMRPFTAYYPYLCRHFTSLHAPVSPRWREILARVDLDQVAHKRRMLAERYVNGLRDGLQLPVPPECLLRNALYGFPVRVDNPQTFHAHLVRRGVRGQVLRDRWWFDTERKPSELCRTHYLLPVNHHLSAGRIDEVTAAANSYVGGASR